MDNGERRTATSPAKRGADQETHFLIAKYDESTDSVMNRPKLDRMTVNNGEDKIKNYPVPY